MWEIGKSLGDLLKLYMKLSINDIEIQKAVAYISEYENKFISSQANKFFKHFNISDDGIKELKKLINIS